MQNLGLTVEERATFEAALRASHQRRIAVAVTDLSGVTLATITPVLLDGQVVVDYDAEVTRSVSLSFLDPAHALSFDTNSPDDGALYADRMLRVTYSVYVEALSRWVDVVVFHGPVTKVDRAGDVVNVEGQGKESLARGALWNTLTLKKGTRFTDGIKTLLVNRAGETDYSIGTLSTKLPSTRSISRYDELWAAAQKLASSVDRQLFYDGTGRLLLRERPATPVYTFRDGQGGDVVAGVQVSYTLDEVKNTVVVKGGKPKGAKKRVYAEAVAPADSPLSPKRLGRPGAPRYLVEVMEDTAIRSKTAAAKKARKLLDDKIREVVDVTFDSLPIPHLDPGDLVAITTDDFSTTFRLLRFTIPLGANGAAPMPVGYLKRTTIIRKRFRT